jgi:tight adherence protein B
MGVVLGLGIALGVLLIVAGLSSSPLQITRPKFPAFTVKRRIDQDVWPEIVDNLASAIRAGLSLPQAIAEIALTAPVQVQPAFTQCATHYQQTGNFSEALLELRQQFADASADKICSALQIAYEVGGADLGVVLRSLSEVIREDARVRHEIMARQSWTVNGAKLAVAAPWLTALVLSMRSDTAKIYFSASGIRMLLFCAFVSVLAYLTMMRIGRLPSQPRLLS